MVRLLERIEFISLRSIICVAALPSLTLTCTISSSKTCGFRLEVQLESVFRTHNQRTVSPVHTDFFPVVIIINYYLLILIFLSDNHINLCTKTAVCHRTENANVHRFFHIASPKKCYVPDIIFTCSSFVNRQGERSMNAAKTHQNTFPNTSLILNRVLTKIVRELSDEQR